MKAAIAAFLVSVAFLAAPLAQSRAGGLPSVAIPYSDAGPTLSTLRDDLIPQPFRGKTPQQREVEWPAWAARNDAAVRARLAAGDADSVVNWLLFGVTFTKHPRITARDLDG